MVSDCSRDLLSGGIARCLKSRVDTLQPAGRADVASVLLGSAVLEVS